MEVLLLRPMNCSFFKVRIVFPGHLVAAIDSIPTTGTTIGVNLNGDPYLKLLYIKQPAGGNLAVDDIQIYSLTTGVEQITDVASVSVYPSPSSGMVFVKLLENKSATSIEIYDLLGNRINNVIAHSNDNGLYRLNFIDKRSGLYFVKIEMDGKLITKRITIQH